MEFIKCTNIDLEKVTVLYHQIIKHLEETINYPQWSSVHPSDLSIKEAISLGEQYACIENGEMLGAVVLSENPDGHYENGKWSQELQEGEYLSIHVLAVNPLFKQRGVGSFMIDQCIKLAKQSGYKAIRLDVVPGNIPAEHLYIKKGFKYAGEVDLQRNNVDIPLFDLYELNLF